jgi:hypothetical protein
VNFGEFPLSQYECSPHRCLNILLPVLNKLVLLQLGLGVLLVLGHWVCWEEARGRLLTLPEIFTLIPHNYAR